MATLVITDGPSEGQQFALERHPLVLIGRDDDCTFQVLDRRVSRSHMQLKLDESDGSYQVIDRDSANSVYINGEKITGPSKLEDGDQIRIGDTTMLFTTADADEAQNAAEAWFKKGQGRFRTSISGDDSPEPGPGDRS
ncbi:MAG: FHA domain-containing protein [Planctomycetota bacterium]|jgi:pSer/pThr/pTyr-binding forkhead associated (FHA) protein